MEQLRHYYEKKRVLVTGGAGFIGSHLVEKLVGLGAQVTILDNFSSGNISNLKNVIGSLNLMYADICSAYSCQRATKGQDIVFHTAAFISVPLSVQFPEFCYKVNTEGTQNMLNACVQNNIKTFIFSSSAAVYGNSNKICSESDQLDPCSPYAISKRDGEVLCRQANEQHGIRTASLRYFNVYGERQSSTGQYAGVAAKFAHQLRMGQPLTIFGTGNQTRDFVNVAKIVDANLIAGMHDAISGDVFNIGSGTSISLLQLINQLEQELNVLRTAVTFQPAREGDIDYSQANCEKFAAFAASNPPLP